jgi:SAM-dependent methyltransferase
VVKTQRSPGNVLGATRYGYAFEQVRRAASRRHLDIGCYDGRFLADLAPLGLERRCGVDVNDDALATGRSRHPELDLVTASDTLTLAFPDDAFDSISLLDVFEHLPDGGQRALLAEVRRVLAPGGRFIITVPGQHAFSLLDLGNLKFRFPGLHRRWYSRRHGEEAYRYRYVANPFGLVGDVSEEKRWHEHFTAQRLTVLLAAAGLTAIDVDGSGLFARPLRITRLVVGGPPGRVLDRLIDLDAQRFGRTNLFLTAT